MGMGRRPERSRPNSSRPPSAIARSCSRKHTAHSRQESLPSIFRSRRSLSCAISSSSRAQDNAVCSLCLSAAHSFES